MTRLIDADALLQAIINYPYGYRGMIESEIENQPTVDAEPVRHGKWKEHNDYPGLAYLCSECGYFTTDRSRFCRNCGARMDEE